MVCPQTATALDCAGLIDIFFYCVRMCVLRMRVVVDTTLPFTEFDDPNIDKEAIILGQQSRVFV